LNKKFNYYKHLISYLTGTCYNFEMEEFFSSFLRRTGMPASAGLSCFAMRWLLNLMRGIATETNKFSDACTGLYRTMSFRMYKTNLENRHMKLLSWKCLNRQAIMT